MPVISSGASTRAPIRSPFLTLGLAWLVPGLGHFLLGRRVRAAIIFVTVLIAFVTGIMMRGPLFQPGGAGDVLSRVIQLGGFIGDLSTGLLYFVAVWFGYAPPDQASHNADYGSKFIVMAGLLNLLAIVDAHEIDTRQKE
jgi:formate hydrogenlyase subunit 3/multisubunit Na+/H+ antiporter MnhD subunit